MTADNPVSLSSITVSVQAFSPTYGGVSFSQTKTRRYVADYDGDPCKIGTWVSDILEEDPNSFFLTVGRLVDSNVDNTFPCECTFCGMNMIGGLDGWGGPSIEDSPNGPWASVFAQISGTKTREKWPNYGYDNTISDPPAGSAYVLVRSIGVSPKKKNWPEPNLIGDELDTLVEVGNDGGRCGDMEIQLSGGDFYEGSITGGWTHPYGIPYKLTGGASGKHLSLRLYEDRDSPPYSMPILSAYPDGEGVTITTVESHGKIAADEGSAVKIRLTGGLDGEHKILKVIDDFTLRIDAVLRMELFKGVLETEFPRSSPVTITTTSTDFSVGSRIIFDGQEVRLRQVNPIRLTAVELSAFSGSVARAAFSGDIQFRADLGSGVVNVGGGDFYKEINPQCNGGFDDSVGVPQVPDPGWEDWTGTVNYTIV